MSSPTKAHEKKRTFPALRAYLPENRKERQRIQHKLTVAAKLKNLSVSQYVLNAAVAAAERDLEAK